MQLCDTTVMIRGKVRLFMAVLCIATVALCSCEKKEGAPESVVREVIQVQASDLHPCEETGTQLTIEDCEAAKYWLHKAKVGTAALSAPTRMWQGQTKRITLAVGTAPPPKQSTEAQPEPAQPPPEAEPHRSQDGKLKLTQVPMSSATAAPKSKVGKTPHQKAEEAADKKDFQVIDYYPFVGRRMSADLSGGGFDIKRISDYSQMVSDGAVTTWEWEVTAKDYGRKKLVIKTAVEMIDSRNQHVPLKATTEYKEIYVIIGPDGVLDWIKSLPDWLKGIAAVITGVGALGAAWRKLREKRKGSGP